MILRSNLAICLMVFSGVVAHAETLSIYCVMKPEGQNTSEIFSIYTLSGSKDQYTVLGTDESVTVAINDADELMIGDVSNKTLLTFNFEEEGINNFKVEGLYQGEFVSGGCNNITEMMAESVEALESERARRAANSIDRLDALIASSEAKLNAINTNVTTAGSLSADQFMTAENALNNLANAVTEYKVQNPGAKELAAEIDRQKALLEQANDLMAGERALSAESQRQVALLNQQTAALRQQLNALHGLLDEYKDADREAKVQLQTLGSDLNTALARVAAVQRANAALRIVVLTEEQRQAIVDAVSRNWNKSIVIGKENYKRLIVVLEVSIAPNGMIVPGSVKPLEPSNPQGDFEVAYEAARRSTLRAEVIPLPANTFSRNIRLELTFDPAADAASLN